MAGLRLTLACGPYDRIEALVNRDVTVSGVHVVHVPVNEPWLLTPERILAEGFDLAEMHLVDLVREKSADPDGFPFTALPVFLVRRFAHGLIVVRDRAGIRGPEDLDGRAMSVDPVVRTEGVWAYGLLKEEFGVDVHLSGGGEHAPGSSECVVTTDRTMSGFRPLFSDPRGEEMSHFTRTGCFPIVSVLALRTELLEEVRWLGGSLYDAFCRSRVAAMAEHSISGASKTMLPWHVREVSEMKRVFGRSIWPYGLEANRPVLEKFRAFSGWATHGTPLPLQSLFASVVEVSD